MEKVTCDNCSFWDIEDARSYKRGNLMFGLCRVNAPVIESDESKWPMTQHTDWCGDAVLDVSASEEDCSVGCKE